MHTESAKTDNLSVEEEGHEIQPDETAKGKAKADNSSREKESQFTSK
jgi:hypothetical protein